MRIWKHAVLAVATAAMATTACQAGLGGLVKLPGSGAGGGGAPAAPGGADGGGDGAAKRSAAGGANATSGGASGTAAVVTAERPAWCEVEGALELRTYSVSSALKATDPRDAVFEIAGHLCSEHPEIDQRDEIVALHARWSERLMMTDADWRDAVEWAVHDQAARAFTRLTVKGKPGAHDPIDQFAIIQGRPGSEVKILLADGMEPELSALGRLAYIEDCLKSDQVGAWLMCHPDVVAFDPSDIVTEIRASTTHSAYERIGVRLQMDMLRAPIAKRIADMDALISSDPAYGDMLEVANRTRSRWRDGVVAPELLDLVSRMESARTSGSRRAMIGCGDEATSAFRAAVAAVPASRLAAAKSIDDVAAVIVGTERGYLATIALMMCDAGTDGGVVSGAVLVTLEGGMRGRPGFRGPRAATMSALFDSGIVLDDRNARVRYPELRSRGYTNASAQLRGGRGVVAAVDTSGEVVTISFAKEIDTYEECVSFKESNRIERILDDGTLVYESSCTKWATRTYNKASAPQRVKRSYAAAVKPGAYVLTADDVVLLVRSKKDGPLAAAFGVELK